MIRRLPRSTRTDTLVPYTTLCRSELMRAHGVATTERGVVEDTVFAGVQFRAGDRVIFLPPLFGLDDQAVDRPDDIDFDREDVRHLVFGAGVHRCIGDRKSTRLNSSH